MSTEKESLEIINKIATLVKENGGETYFVGGCVRDELLKVECKDYDIEVYNIEPEKLEKLLDQVGTRIEVGKAFSVYNLKGYSVDIALPRREYAIGDGHKDFTIVPDPFISTRDAAIRRDFTVNALMKNVITNEIIDHFGGLDDLKNKKIRHVNDRSFAEDPLRVFRAAQFAARFEFEIVPETQKLCSAMKIDALPKERVFDELRKALLKANRPSIFFEELRKMNLLDRFFPELKALIGIEQNPKHHSEGDVWVHTMMVLDECAKRRHLVKNPIGFMLSALVHDFGKAVCTEIVNGEIHAYNHETIGIPIAETFLNRITSEKNLIKYVLNLSELHMKPNVLAGAKSSVKSTNKLFDSAVEPLDLIHLAVADSLGKTAPRPYIPTEPFLMERLAVYEEMMAKPFVMGKDLVEAGLTPDKNFSDILAYAHKLRLAGCDKNSALKQTLAYARKFYGKK